MKVGTESRNKLKHKSTSKNSKTPTEKGEDFTMPIIPLPSAKNAQST